MSWVEFEFGDIVDKIKGGGTPSKQNQEYWNGDIFWASVKDMEEGKYKLSSTQDTITQIGLENSASNLIPKDTLIIATRMGLGRAFINEVDLTINQDLKAIFPKLDVVDTKFLLWWYVNNGKYIENLGNGATVKGIRLEQLKAIKIYLPPLPTQKRIASILSTYDDLIENNLKRIKLLEETAQNIYKEWFVNFRFPNYENTQFNEETGLPEGWETDVIGNQLLTIKRNGKLKTEYYELEGKFPIIDQGSGFIAGYTNNEEIVQNSHLPIIIFGDHTRRVKFVNFPFVSGADGTQLMFPKNENLNPAYFYLSIKLIDLSNYAYARHFKFMKEQIITIPDNKVLEIFNKKVYPILEQTIQLFKYNQKLKEARDVLLPRLMNRTIEV